MAWLSDMGATIKGYSLAPDSSQNLYLQLKGDQRCESVIADIRNADRLKQEIHQFKPDVVFHLAAQPLVRLAYSQPLETWDINVMGTAHVLNALRHLDKSCVAVIVTTDKVYENLGSPYLYRETDRLGGHDPYSASKAAAELIVGSFRSSYFPIDRFSSHGIAIASARAGNVFGGGDWAEDRLVPDAIRAFSQGKRLCIRSPYAVRPWQHVLDPLSGYIELARALQRAPEDFSRAWNFGPWPQDHLTVLAIAKQVAGRWGSGQIDLDDATEHVHESGLLKLDISQTVALLGWEPKWTVAEGLERAVRWYADVANGKDAGAQCRQDIQAYHDA